MFETKEKLIMAVYKYLPYSNQIIGLDITSESNAISFNWRGNILRVTLDGDVNEVEGSLLLSSDLCILFRELVKIRYTNE